MQHCQVKQGCQMNKYPTAFFFLLSIFFFLQIGWWLVPASEEILRKTLYAGERYEQIQSSKTGGATTFSQATFFPLPFGLLVSSEHLN